MENQKTTHTNKSGISFFRDFFLSGFFSVWETVSYYVTAFLLFLLFF